MKITKNILLLFLVATVTLTCKEDKNGGGGEETGGNFPGELQGVWQEVLEGFDAEDELGIYFTSTTIASWDYDGDAFDEGDDCYFNFEIGELISRSGNTYRIDVNEALVDFVGEEVSVSYTVDGNVLTEAATGETESYDYVKDSRAVSDLTPECSFEFKAAPSDELKRKLSGLFKQLK